MLFVQPLCLVNGVISFFVLFVALHPLGPRIGRRNWEISVR